MGDEANIGTITAVRGGVVDARFGRAIPRLRQLLRAARASLAAMIEADGSVRGKLGRLRHAHRQARQAAIADERGDRVAGVGAPGGPAEGFSARMPGSEPPEGDPSWPHSPPAP